MYTTVHFFYFNKISKIDPPSFLPKPSLFASLNKAVMFSRTFVGRFNYLAVLTPVWHAPKKLSVVAIGES